MELVPNHLYLYLCYINDALMRSVHIFYIINMKFVWNTVMITRSCSGLDIHLFDSNTQLIYTLIKLCTVPQIFEQECSEFGLCACTFDISIHICIFNHLIDIKLSMVVLSMDDCLTKTY